MSINYWLMTNRLICPLEGRVAQTDSGHFILGIFLGAGKAL